MLCENEELNTIKEMLRKNPRGMSITDISRELNLNRNSVAKYVNMLLVAGEVEMKTYAAAKVYYLSQRVPLSAMLDFSTDAIVILDANLTVVRVNDNFLAMSGTTREALMGNSIRGSSLPAFSDEKIIASLQDALHGLASVKEIAWQSEGRDLFLKGKLIPTVFEDGSVALTIILENITGQVRAQQALETSEALYRAIVEDQTELVCRLLLDGTITFTNRECLRFFSFDKEDLAGVNIRSFLSGDEWEHLEQEVRKLSCTNPTTTFDNRIIMPDKKIRFIQWVVRAICNPPGEIIEYQFVGRDVTALRESTAQIERSLKEKETFLTEINYRIRSNLHFISSLIDLQAESRKDPASQELLREEKQQIMALARIYEILTQSDDINHIPLFPYLRKLSEDLYSSYHLDSDRVKTGFRADDIWVDINTAIPVGLLFNELVSNSFKHAFPEGRKGEVNVDIHGGAGEVTLTITDDGIGIPENVDIHAPHTIGMELVNVLVNQIDGHITLDQRNGTRFSIVFPYPGP
jgi:PAS domain S-box-containing protein